MKEKKRKWTDLGEIEVNAGGSESSKKERKKEREREN